MPRAIVYVELTFVFSTARKAKEAELQTAIETLVTSAIASSTDQVSRKMPLLINLIKGEASLVFLI